MLDLAMSRRTISSIYFRPPMAAQPSSAITCHNTTITLVPCLVDCQDILRCHIMSNHQWWISLWYVMIWYMIYAICIYTSCCWKIPHRFFLGVFRPWSRWTLVATPSWNKLSTCTCPLVAIGCRHGSPCWIQCAKPQHRGCQFQTRWRAV